MKKIVEMLTAIANNIKDFDFTVLMICFHGNDSFDVFDGSFSSKNWKSQNVALMSILLYV